ncbi:GGDEF domain-containing protein [Sesbania bispinosa]|nr:GGDEF domain-containing protein [Sesbania bispinosa]
MKWKVGDKIVKSLPISKRRELMQLAKRNQRRENSNLKRQWCGQVQDEDKMVRVKPCQRCKGSNRILEFVVQRN